jgi:hypothetical protein
LKSEGRKHRSTSAITRPNITHKNDPSTSSSHRRQSQRHYELIDPTTPATNARSSFDTPHVTRSFQAEGLAARLRLEARGRCAEAFAAIDEGDTRQGLQALLAALPGVEDEREDVRCAIVGELDVLGPEDPLARETRRQLAAALY